MVQEIRRKCPAVQFLVALNHLLPSWNRCWWNAPWSSTCICIGRVVSWDRREKRLCWYSDRVGMWHMPLQLSSFRQKYHGNQLTAFRVACRDGADLLLNVSCWLWVKAQIKSCMLEVPVLTINIPQISPSSAPAFLIEGAQVGCARCTQAQGESPQCILVAPVFHQVGVDLLEMQECQKSYIWTWNFYFSLKDTIRTFQAVCWRVLLLFPYGKTGSEFHLMKWALSLCQRNHSWVMPCMRSWKSCSADSCKLEPKSTVTEEPVFPFRMAVVCAYMFTPDGRGWQMNTLK